MKKLICIFSLLLLASCKDHKTNGSFLTEHKDVWMNGYGASADDKEKGDKGLVYCRANAKDDGTAEPKCFRANFNQPAKK